MLVAKFLCTCGTTFLKFNKLKEHLYRMKDGTGKHLPVKFKAEEVKENDD